MSNFTLRKHTLLIVLAFILLVSSFAKAKSLYVLRHGAMETRELLAFDISESQLVFQSQVVPPGHGYGPVDLAIDNDSKTLFVSYEANGSNEGGDMIELFDTRDIDSKGNIQLEGATNATGIIYDSQREKLYCTQRNTNDLYIYSWDADDLTLTLDPCMPIDLDYIQKGATDLAINGNKLYVSDYTYSDDYEQVVHAYDLTDNCSWLKDIDMGEDTVSIAYNSTDDAIYAGAIYFGTGGYPGTDNKYLIKRTLDPDSTIVKDIEANVIGVATDPSYPECSCPGRYGSV